MINFWSRLNMILVAGVLFSLGRPGLASTWTEYRSLLSLTPGLVDVASSGETPSQQWQGNTFNGRFRSALELEQGPRAEGWRTATGATPDQPFALRLELKKPLLMGTVIACGSEAFQVQAVSDTGGARGEMIGDESNALRVMAFTAGSQPVKRLTFTATQVTQKYQNNFNWSKDKVDQKLVYYDFQLNGVYVFAEALENLTPYAKVAVNGIGDVKEAERDSITAEGLIDRSPEHYWRSLASNEWAEALLTWARPVEASVVGCLIPWKCFAKVPERVEFYAAEAVPVPGMGQPRWQPMGVINNFNNSPHTGQFLYLLKSPEPRTFSAMKVRFFSSRGQMEVGKLLVLGEIKGKRQADTLAGLQPKNETPPIRVPYKLPGSGVAGWLGGLVHTPKPVSAAQKHFTLVIEDAQGKRIRNLIADEPVTGAGGEALWDGLDEDGKLVSPGSYVARGLVHEPFRAEYVLSANIPPGPAPWVTKDHRGGWLSDHCGASAIEFLDGHLWMGAQLAEAGDTIIKTDQDGRKEWGLRWLELDGARLITSANGKIYVGSSGGWRARSSQVISVTELDPESCQFKRILDLRPDSTAGKTARNGDAEAFSGLAVSADKIYLAFRDENRIDTYDLATGKALNSLRVPSPRGMMIEAPGRALVLSGTTVQRCDLRTGVLEPVGVSGLQDPVNLTMDSVGNILVADRGAGQVFMYSAQGKLLKTLGVAGGRKPGLYDPLAFDRPMDVAVDGTGRIWVAEAGFQPKRISAWNPDGTLWREFIGPGHYACGGFLDPADRTRFFAEGMEFSLDYVRGGASLKAVVYPGSEKSFFKNSERTAERALRVKNNLFLIADHHWCMPLFWFGIMKGDRLKPVAAVGDYSWASTFFGKARPEVPAGKEKEFTFLWQDENGDGEPQWEELQLRSGSFFVPEWELRMGDDLSFYWAEGGKRILRLAPASWSATGEPRYDVSAAVTVYEDNLRNYGGLKAAAPLGGCRLLLNRKPLQCLDMATGKILWSYRNDWPSNTHDSPLPNSGQLQHTLNSEGIVDLGGDIGAIFSLNSNKGLRHLMTVDGLYIAPVFRDMRVAPGLAMADVSRGQDLIGYSLYDEAFLGSFQRGSDGEIYMTGGKCHHTLYRICGLDTIKRFKNSFTVSPESVAAAEAYGVACAIRRRQSQLTCVEAVVSRAKTPPPLEARPGAWPDAPALSVQQQNKPLFEARLQHDRETLYLAVRVWDASPFVNSGEDPKLLFKTGDSVNLELGTGRISLKDHAPAPGDIRVLLAPFHGKPVVVIYRYKVAGASKPMAFRSPIREVLVDRLEILDTLPVKVQLVSGGYTLFAALPKALLGLPADFNGTCFGDLGVVFSDPAGAVNNYVCFWASPAKGITADVPSEIMIQPQFWKPLVFEKQ